MNAEFVIVGGGIVGGSIAYHLSTRTSGRIVVVERADQLASETTAKSNAMFRMTGSATEREMKRYGLAMYNEFLADPVRDHAADPLFERLDRLEVATTTASTARLRERAEEGPATYLEPEEIPTHLLLPELAVEAIEGALWFPDAIRLEPRALAFEFFDRAASNGVEIMTGTAVRDVHVEGNRVTGVATTQGDIDAEFVVSAAGPNNVDIAELAGIDLPSRHTLGPILDVRPTRWLGHTVPNLKHVESGVYYTGRGDGTVMIGRAGGGYEQATRRDLDTLETDRVPDAIRTDMDDAASQVIPALALDAVEIHDEWVGLVSKTPDGEPIIGRTSREGFAVAAFHSEAIQLAPAAGRIMSEQLLDDTPPSAYPNVSPGRFEDAVNDVVS